MESLTDELLVVATRYAALTGRSLARVSTLAFGSGHRLKNIARGRDVTVRCAERGLRWLSDNWPPDNEWPQNIPRPKPAAEDV